MAGERNLAASSGGGIDWTRPSQGEPRRLKRATYDDVLSAPENKVAEILDGELFLSPRPAPRHSVAASRLGAVLGPFDYGLDGPGAWWIIFEPECHFGENVLVPDLGGWRRERLPAIPDTAFFSLAPDWVCEVLSPSTERIDRGRKLRIYAEAGVAHTWLVNPVERTLEVLRLRDGVWTIVAVCSGSDAVRVEPFDAIELALARLWVDAPASPDPLQPGPG
jgi:Uma2 family endonuclease